MASDIAINDLRHALVEALDRNTEAIGRLTKLLEPTLADHVASMAAAGVTSVDYSKPVMLDMNDGRGPNHPDFQRQAFSLGEPPKRRPQP